MRVRLVMLFVSVGTISGTALENAEMGEECKQKYLHEQFLQDDFHGFLNDAQTTSNKTQASDPIKGEYFWMKILKTYHILGWEALKHTTHLIWILKGYYSGCYYVGLLHNFVRFFEALVFIL